MRILYITYDDIRSPNCGCAQRSAFLYKSLCECGEVEVFNPRKFGEGSLLRRLFAVSFRKLTKVARWPFRAKVKELACQKWDAVVVRYLMTAAEFEAWQYGPCYVDIDDLPEKAFANIESKRLPKILRPLGGFLVKAWQRYCLGKCAGAWVVSDEEREYVGKLVHANVGVLRNIARAPGQAYNPDVEQDRLLMTVGLMGYQPNAEGVDWFLNDVWPKVHERWPELCYAIAGGGAKEETIKKWSMYPNVKVLGFVDDLDALYGKSVAVVAPILSGAGTCIKVIEAALHGRKVFATPKALRGNENLAGTEKFIDAHEFIHLLDKWFKCLDARAIEQSRIADYAKREYSFDGFRQSVKNLLGAAAHGI